MAEALRRSMRPSLEGQQRRHRPDYWILIFMTLLLAIGMIVVYAISPALAVANGTSENYYVGHQLLAVALGAVIFGITATIPLRQWHIQCRTMYILRLYSIVLQWCRWTFVAGDFLRIMLQITMRRVLNTILCHLFCAPLPILDAPKYLPVHVCGATISVVVQKL